MDKFTGKVWVLGDDIDTDIIIPTEYLALKTIDDMKQYGFSPLRPELAGQIQKGDIIVAGRNFGKNLFPQFNQQWSAFDRAAGSV